MVQILRGLSFGLSFLILWGWGWFPHCQEQQKRKLRKRFLVRKHRSQPCVTRQASHVRSQPRTNQGRANHEVPISYGRLSAERIFRGFLFLSRRIFSRIFSRRIFSLLISVGKSAQKNPPGKSPGKPSKIYTTKILQHISADCPGQKL